jgi:hypothetical protein
VDFLRRWKAMDETPRRRERRLGTKEIGKSSLDVDDDDDDDDDDDVLGQSASPMITPLNEQIEAK